MDDRPNTTPIGQDRKTLTFKALLLRVRFSKISLFCMTGGRGGGGPTEVHILYPQKIQTPEFVYPKKNSLLFFSIPKKIPRCFCIRKCYYLFSGKLKHANFNFGFGQKQNYTKANTKSSHDCYSVSASYLLRQLYRKIFIMTSTTCLVLSTFFACYCTETSLCKFTLYTVFPLWSCLDWLERP